jgi:hypothetical protein
MSEEDNTQGDMETSIEGNPVEDLSQPKLESAPENKGVGEGLGEDELAEQMVPSDIPKTQEQESESVEHLGKDRGRRAGASYDKKGRGKTSVKSGKRESTLTDIAKQLERQTSQIDKMNRNLEPLQKQAKTAQKQAVSFNQIPSEISLIRKQIYQVQNSLQKITKTKTRTKTKTTRTNSKAKRKTSSKARKKTKKQKE